MINIDYSLFHLYRFEASRVLDTYANKYGLYAVIRVLWFNIWYKALV